MQIVLQSITEVKQSICDPMFTDTKQMFKLRLREYKHGASLQQSTLNTRTHILLYYYQGIYRYSIAKFPDFSSQEITISLTLSKQ